MDSRTICINHTCFMSNEKDLLNKVMMKLLSSTVVINLIVLTYAIKGIYLAVAFFISEPTMIKVYIKGLVAIATNLLFHLTLKIISLHTIKEKTDRYHCIYVTDYCKVCVCIKDPMDDNVIDYSQRETDVYHEVTITFISFLSHVVIVLII